MIQSLEWGLSQKLPSNPAINGRKIDAKKIYILAFLLLLVCLLNPSSTSANIFLNEDKSVTPWIDCKFDSLSFESLACRATGVILCDDYSVSTGFIVNIDPSATRAKPSVILMTAHGLFTKDGIYHGNCVFHPINNRKEPNRITEVLLPSDPVTVLAKGNYHLDWAIAVLQNAPSEANTSLNWASSPYIMEANGVPRDEAVFLVGYDTASKQLQIVNGCHLVPTEPTKYGESPFEARHNCNVVQGFSGAPLIRNQANDHTAICMHTNFISVSDEKRGDRKPIYFSPATANYCRLIDAELLDALTALRNADVSCLSESIRDCLSAMPWLHSIKINPNNSYKLLEITKLDAQLSIPEKPRVRTFDPVQTSIFPALKIPERPKIRDEKE